MKSSLKYEILNSNIHIKNKKNNPYIDVLTCIVQIVKLKKYIIFYVYFWKVINLFDFKTF